MFALKITLNFSRLVCNTSNGLLTAAVGLSTKIYLTDTICTLNKPVSNICQVLEGTQGVTSSSVSDQFLNATARLQVFMCQSLSFINIGMATFALQRAAASSSRSVPNVSCVFSLTCPMRKVLACKCFLNIMVTEEG